MDLRLKPGLAAKIDQWSAQTGRPACDLVEDAVAAYFNELGELRARVGRLEARGKRIREPAA